MKQFFRNLILGDWLLKLFSLMLALLTWIAVSDSLRKKAVEVPGKPDLAEKHYFDLPVRIVSGSADVHDYKLKPSEVNVKLQGDKNTMLAVERRMIHVQVDLTNLTITNGTRRPVEVIPPAGTMAVEIQPGEIEVIPPAPAPPAGQ
jgi:YbbR domain-containing protein